MSENAKSDPLHNVPIILSKGMRYFRANDVAKALGYSNYRKAIFTHVPKEHIFHGSELGSTKNINYGNTRFLDTGGVSHLVHASRLPGSLGVARRLGIPLSTKYKKHYQELSTLKVIMDAFEGEKMMRQYWIAEYRVDLYFPEYKIIVECDENDHRGYDKTKEESRSRVLSRSGSRLVRYNPDDKEFDIIRVINQIYRLIKGL
jgi:very-short-patch-repair endonuclease